MPDATCIVCEDPVNMWIDDKVIDAYQKDGANHYSYKCPDCGIIQNHSIPLEDVPQVMTYDTLMRSLKVLIMGE